MSLLLNTLSHYLYLLLLSNPSLIHKHCTRKCFAPHFLTEFWDYALCVLQIQYVEVPVEVPVRVHENVYMEYSMGVPRDDVYRTTVNPTTYNYDTALVCMRNPLRCACA